MPRLPRARRLSLLLGAVLAPSIAPGRPMAAQRAPNDLRSLTLRPGLVITTSARIAARTYRLPAPHSPDSALLIVRGDDVTVDFGGAVLEGTARDADPDAAAGVAILIDGGRNVRIRHARIHGYKVAILARGTRGLELADIDASHNWKPRLFSLVEHESLADWLSFHNNDRDEWRRFGAAFYLAGVRAGVVRGNTVEQGMNGLLLVGCDSLRVQDNDFSFNSGLGIGLYRSSDNSIVHNRVDYNVRGYSHGFYRRGQDSADILLYEQSSRNLVAFNSATHGGDGLFLWAGQSTMESGDGGANDNVFYGNDFSFAPANGMEATFSRNSFSANHVEGNEYGLWAGYSYDSWIAGNCFIHNRTGVAIEHGQANAIEANTFDGDSVAIRLWADTIQPSDWGYPKHRDTRSRDYRIVDNRFIGTPARVVSANTTFARDDSGDSTDTSSAPCVLPQTPLSPHPEPLAQQALWRELHELTRTSISAPRSAMARRDRSAIVVDEWGPFDWRSPKLWPADSSHAMPVRLSVIGPPGKWRVATRRGVATISRLSGRVGDTIEVTPRSDRSGDWELTLEYVGSETRSAHGLVTAAGRPVRFSYSRFEPMSFWDARFFTWSDSTDPQTRADAFSALLGTRPLFTARVSRLDYEWYRPVIRELPLARWALDASASVTLAPGEYTLRTISDDGVRVWVDGQLVIEDWSLHGSAIDYAALTAGRHDLRVQFFQVDGWTELRIDILRGAVRSTGSPGPH